MASKCGQGTFVRNNTSFPVRVSARLRELFEEYTRLRADGGSSPEALAAGGLKYYQYLIRTVMTNPEYGIGECGNARGLLIYHTMGMGKTFLAVAAAMAMWDVRSPVVIVPKSIQKNFQETIEKFVALMNPTLSGDALRQKQAAAVKRFRFVSLDAYNMAKQVARVTSGSEGSGSLNNHLLIVDEAHNLFRAIINSSNENTNARQLYEMVMEARNLRILFLTGTVPSKDPFELVPCFNMLAGYDLLPTQYEVFYKHYVNAGTPDSPPTINNRGKLANRLLGLVSHATHTLPSDPSAAADDAGSAKHIRDVGGFPEEMPLIIESVEMSPDQYRQYLLEREKEEAEGKGSGGPGGAPTRERITNSPALSLPGSEAGAGSTYYVRSRSLSNFTPSEDDRDMAVTDMPDSTFTDLTSPKIARLVENVETSPGPALVYSQFVDVGGLAVVARFLRGAGYAEYVVSSSGSKGTSSGSKGTSSGPKAPSSAPKTHEHMYAVISGDVKPDDRVRIQEVFNSPKNAHGELIKVLLVSKTGAEGLDLKGVRQVHILEPYWDKSREDQVKARGVRLGSHDHLPREEREVQPYLYIAAANQKMFEGMQPTTTEKTAPPQRYKLIETQTIDQWFHTRGLNKHTLNLMFRDLLRDVCLECAINGYGNCRLCVPTDAPLFHEDPIRDLSLPDPCDPLVEIEVNVHEIQIDGTTYFYQKNPSAPFGVQFFEYDEELEAHSPVDPSSGLFVRLHEAFAEQK